MEVLIKCDHREEAELYGMVSKLCPDLKDIFCEDVEIRSLDVKFHKVNDEIELYISEDVSRMIIKKISSAGSVFKIIWTIMNNSINDIIDEMGEFDVLVNGKLMNTDYSGDDENEDFGFTFSDKDHIPTMQFEGV